MQKDMLMMHHLYLLSQQIKATMKAIIFNIAIYNVVNDIDDKYVTYIGKEITIKYANTIWDTYTSPNRYEGLQIEIQEMNESDENTEKTITNRKTKLRRKKHRNVYIVGDSILRPIKGYELKNEANTSDSGEMLPW